MVEASYTITAQSQSSTGKEEDMAVRKGAGGGGGSGGISGWLKGGGQQLVGVGEGVSGHMG